MTQIPEILAKRINKIKELIDQNKIKVKRKIAVFDLDNTLLIGDIGEAVFAALKNKESEKPLTIQNKPLPFSWHEYQNQLKKNQKAAAYKKMVTAMSGLPLHTLINTTREVLKSTENCIHLEKEQIPIPVPNKMMQAVLALLKAHCYEIFIISASNHFSVQFVAREYFSLPTSAVFGIRSRLKYHQNVSSGEKIPVLTSRLEKPISVGRGKAEVYHQYIHSIPPLITAGDSETDIEMLNLTDKSGISIWVGNDQKQYEKMKKKARFSGFFFFLNQPSSQKSRN
jgi:phosphoserine phosphatase